MRVPSAFCLSGSSKPRRSSADSSLNINSALKARPLSVLPPSSRV
ncbi:hypothetical protein [Deinococcus apachensis]|nr:hypothetical protein [Deinococcus apachensis]